MSNKSSQQFLEIEQIREGVLVLKDKSLRGIMMISSLNFALKSEDEQTGIIYQFQSFLNSLDFSCQIVVQSRQLNITGYLEKLNQLAKKQENELLKIQTEEYRKFIKGMVSTGAIMSKTFYVVIPFYLSEAKGATLKTPKIHELNEEMFQRCKAQLWQRMEFLALGLKRCGLKTVMLKTEEIIELFWGLYHPKQAEFGYYPDLPPEIIR